MLGESGDVGRRFRQEFFCATQKFQAVLADFYIRSAELRMFERVQDPIDALPLGGQLDRDRFDAGLARRIPVGIDQVEQHPYSMTDFLRDSKKSARVIP